MSLPLIFAPSAIENIEQMAAWAGRHSAAARTKLLAATLSALRGISHGCFVLSDSAPGD